MCQNQSPRVFISYSHESNGHNSQVVSLSDRLRDDGIECVVDQYLSNTPPRHGWPTWCLEQLDISDYVLAICTLTYYRRFHRMETSRIGKGVKWEGFVLTDSIYQCEGNEKIIPVLLSSDEQDNIPTILRSYQYYDLSTESGYDLLYRRLTGQPEVIMPKKGNIRSLPTGINRNHQAIHSGSPDGSSNQKLNSDNSMVAPSKNIRENIKEKKHLILYVDDEVNSLKYFKKIFEKDYRIITAESGYEAIEKIKIHHDITLIITDQRMAGMQGFDLLRHSIDLLPNAKRVLTTAYTEDLLNIKLLMDAARIHDIIEKPWNLEDLEDHIKRLVNEHDAEETNANISLNKHGYICRSIEFDPEHHQAGLGILSYFGKVVRDKYPSKKVSIRIEQYGLKVTMVVVTQKGDTQVIEKTLTDYNSLVAGEYPIEEFFDNDLRVTEFKHKLDLAALEIKYYKELLHTERKMYEKRIGNLEDEIGFLRKFFSSGLTSSPSPPNPIREEKQEFLFMLFSDMKDFASLSNQEKMKIQRLSNAFKLEIENDSRYVNTWEDAFVILTDDLMISVDNAFKLREHFRDYELRIGLHCAHLNIGLENGRIVDFSLVDGDKLGRIEPLVSPNSIWCSEAFKNLLDKDHESRKFVLFSLGARPLAKNYPKKCLYLILLKKDAQFFDFESYLMKL